jgi:hypothetical protein
MADQKIREDAWRQSDELPVIQKYGDYDWAFPGRELVQWTINVRDMMRK